MQTPTSDLTVAAEIEYPESDGKPMGETDIHIEWIIRLRDMLKWRFRDQQTYVAGNLLVYYEPGNSRKFIVPDVFVVHDCDPGLRRTFKVWEEGQAPHAVIEVTSRSSRREDAKLKPQVYAQIGVREYFVYDPESEYLKPPLQGHRRSGSAYERIKPDAEGMLFSEVLGLHLHLDGRNLVLTDASTGARLLTRAEAADRAEAEVARLRRLLDERSQSE